MKALALILISSLLLACTSVRIHGEPIKQSSLCSELGYGKECNPLPYGTSLILDKTRWSIPVDPNLDLDDKESVYEKIITTFLGGQIINTKLLTPSIQSIDKYWIDYHYGPLNLERKFEKTFTLDIEVPINEILTQLLSANTISLDDSEKAKEELESSFKKFTNSKGTIKLIYHTAKLNGNWYNAMQSGNPIARKLVSYKNLNKKNIYKNDLGDEFSYIGGIGVIEYNVTKTDSLSKLFKAALEQKVGLSNELSLSLATKLTNEVTRTTSTQVPNRLDVVFVSKLDGKIQLK